MTAYQSYVNLINATTNYYRKNRVMDITNCIYLKNLEDLSRNLTVEQAQQEAPVWNL